MTFFQPPPKLFEIQDTIKKAWGAIFYIKTKTKKKKVNLEINNVFCIEIAVLIVVAIGYTFLHDLV